MLDTKLNRVTRWVNPPSSSTFPPPRERRTAASKGIKKCRRASSFFFFSPPSYQKTNEATSPGRWRHQQNQEQDRPRQVLFALAALCPHTWQDQEGGGLVARLTHKSWTVNIRLCLFIFKNNQNMVDPSHPRPHTTTNTPNLCILDGYCKTFGQRLAV